MRKLHIFFFVLAITLSILVTLLAVSWYYAATAPTYYGDSWMGQMWGSHIGTNQNNWGMGGMMGGNNGNTAAPSYLWIIPVVLIVIVVTAIVGVGFYIAYPELKFIKSRSECSTQIPTVTAAKTPDLSQSPSAEKTTETPATPKIPVSQSCDLILKTMTPEEQKVYNILVAHKGKYLQKYVVKESGLSRLKTHRIVARFAQRGIVTVNEFGNTNEIALSDWAKS